MALFNECRERHAHIALDTADIVRDGDLSSPMPVNCAKLTTFSFRTAVYEHTVKAKKITLKQVQAVLCPTCGAGPGEKCKLGTGLPRTQPHRDRRLLAAD